MNSHPVLIVLAIAVAAPLLAEIPVGVRLPVVMLEMVLGIIVGPQVLGLATAEGLLGWLGGKLGLAALFFMAGMELDLERVRGRPLTLAIRGWVLSLVLGLVVAALLYVLPIVHSPMMVGLALSTTALGTLLPILRDAGQLETEFGRLVLAAGAVGEFGPVVVVSLVLTGEDSEWLKIGLMLMFVAIAFGAARIALGARPPIVIKLLTRTMESSSQLPVRISLLLLAVFVVLSENFGFELIPGAFAAGMVVGLASRGEAGNPLRHKVEAVCFGFLVPFFFVTSGIKFDLATLLHSAQAILLLPAFLILLFIVRGVPALLYGHNLAKGQRLPFALYSATALPLLVAISAIVVQTGRMRPEIAAALVGAGMLSVLLFPTFAGILLSRITRTSTQCTNLPSTL
jgi:Kef-type K+ transport system membrane component KefB